MDRADPDLDPTLPIGSPRPDSALDATRPHTHTPLGSTTGRSSTPEWLGRYQVVRELARGGMGVVYIARDPQLDREVAIKQCLSAQGIGSAAAVEEQQRFQREAKAVASLQHPHIVSVFDVGEEGDGSYIVMDLIRGESLQDRVLREGMLPEREVARIGVKLARALSYAHARSILHRDVKPHNVLVDEEGEPHLTDFGLAKVADLRDLEPPAQPGPEVDLTAGASLTLTGQLLGTPAYMAPEQAGGEPLDERADVYGLGATLYALLTGSSPHPGKTLPVVLHAVLHQALVPPKALRADLDPGLNALVSRCLAKNRDERYPSCDAVAEALEAWLQRPPSEPPAAPSPERSAAPLVTGLILAAAAVGVGAVVAQRSAAPPEPGSLPSGGPIPTPTASPTPATGTTAASPSPTPTGPRLKLEESYTWAADPGHPWLEQPDPDPRREWFALARRTPDTFVRIVTPLRRGQTFSPTWAFEASGVGFVPTPTRVLLATGRLSFVAQSDHIAKLRQTDDDRYRVQPYFWPAQPWVDVVLSDAWVVQVKAFGKETWRLEAHSTTWTRNRTAVWNAERATAAGVPALRIGEHVVSLSAPKQATSLFRLPRRQTKGMTATPVARLPRARGDLLAISPRDDRIAVRREESARIEFLRLPELNVVGAIPDARCDPLPASSAFSPDGQHFAWVDQTVHVVRVDDPTRPASVARQPGWVAFFFHADRSLTVLTKGGVRRFELTD